MDPFYYFLLSIMFFNLLDHLFLNQWFNFFWFLVINQSSTRAESGMLASVPSVTWAERPLSDNSGMTLKMANHSVYGRGGKGSRYNKEGNDNNNVNSVFTLCQALC
jgi:hypothetical protein